MKTYLNYPNNINNNLQLKKGKINKQDYDKNNSRENTKMNRPAQAISFSGSMNLNKGLNKAFNKTVEFVNDNEVAYNAIYSLIIAGIIKPLFVLNMPGSEDKDKQIVATKNFLQAFIGSFLGFTIGGNLFKKSMDIVKNNRNMIEEIKDNKIVTISPDSPKALEMAEDILKKEYGSFKYRLKAATASVEDKTGFEKISQFLTTLFKKTKKTPTVDQIAQKAKSLIENFNTNHKQIYEKNPDFIKLLKSEMVKKSGTTYAEGFDSFWKNFTGTPTAISKAIIASCLLPPVMSFLFSKRNAMKAQEKQAREGNLINNASFKNQQEQFKQMMNKNNNNNGNISFKGDYLARLIEEAGMTKPMAGAVKLLSHTKKPSARMADLESFMITGYWVNNTRKSKKIEPSQKLGLNVHTILVTLASSTAAFLIDSGLDGLIDKAKNGYKEKIEKALEFIKLNKDELLKERKNINYGAASNATKLAIGNICAPLIDGASDEDIKNAIRELKKLEVVQESMRNGFELTDDLIKDVVFNLNKSIPLKEALLEQCGDMLGAKKIAKTFSNMNLDDTAAVGKEIGKLAGSYGKKLSKFKSLTIFTLVVRFLVPVLMVPISGKMKKKILEMQEKKAAQKSQIA